MKLLVPLLFSIQVYGQCDPHHCKPRFTVIDSCGTCFTHSDFSGLFPLDSIMWDFGNGQYITNNDDTVCHQFTQSGTYWVYIRVLESVSWPWQTTWVWGRSVDIDLSGCGCMINEDCNDNDICTIDLCLDDKTCKNIHAFSSISSTGTLETWKLNCCKCN